ncbi:WXG100 family type VII secretion target [Actinacidiphila bryophytorum]|uniref:WXG100 family type VII secretion target n=1 Tax=Actinacidiphila bryophytorum TaxID=1436133 RepID=UPI002176B94C|nr:WXG100 family type VII secretion target [Actinacidiphila bryophytorum]UWE13267.1 WXG100 family type VII secretion target [Actinacidiphila bryophytorum]
MTQLRLHATDADLTRLAGDLDGMQEHLATQIRKLNALVDAAEKGWRSPAASVYRDLQRSANADAETVRKMLALVEEAVRLSRDGFSAQDLDTLESFRALEVPDDRPASDAPAPGTPAAPPPPRSRVADL